MVGGLTVAATTSFSSVPSSLTSSGDAGSSGGDGDADTSNEGAVTVGAMGATGSMGAASSAQHGVSTAPVPPTAAAALGTTAGSLATAPPASLPVSLAGAAAAAPVPPQLTPIERLRRLENIDHSGEGVGSFRERLARMEGDYGIVVVPGSNNRTRLDELEAEML